MTARDAPETDGMDGGETSGATAAGEESPATSGDRESGTTSTAEESDATATGEVSDATAKEEEEEENATPKGEESDATATGEGSDATATGKMSDGAGPRQVTVDSREGDAGRHDARGTAGDESLAGDERVLLVGTFGGGGVHQYVDALAERLDDHVDVSTYDMATPAAGDGPRWFLRGLLAGLWAACTFPVRRRPDVVHVHASHRFSFYRAALYVLVAAVLWRRPVVLHVHGSSFDEFVASSPPPVAALQAAVFGASDRIVVLSPYWRDVLHREAGVPTEKLVVAPNAVAPERFEPTYDADPPELVFVSNLVERKGVPELVEAIDVLADEVAFEVTIAGDGPLAPAVRDLADRHENVSAPGYVDEATKRRLLSAGSVFVLPTRAEGLPIAMLEGMAGGNAVVSTTVGSIPEVIGDEGGVLVEPGDVDALVAALESLLDDSARVRRMGRHNRRLVEERYAWRRVLDRILAVYGELTPRAND